MDKKKNSQPRETDNLSEGIIGQGIGKEKPATIAIPQSLSRAMTALGETYDRTKQDVVVAILTEAVRTWTIPDMLPRERPKDLQDTAFEINVNRE